MGSVRPQLLTAEDFWLLPESEMRRSLVRGEVVESRPSGGRHGVVASELDFHLRAWARSPDGLARTYSDSDVLEQLDVLPGFSCAVAELFE